MSLSDIHEIELDQSVYHKAYIVWRRADGTIANKAKVKWEKRWDAFGKAHKAWIEAKLAARDAVKLDRNQQGGAPLDNS